MARGVSLRALQWLEWVQANHPACYNERTKKRELIQHAYSPGGEYIVDEKWPVDGYIDFGHRKVFFEFNGCYWHSCIKCVKNADDEAGVTAMTAEAKERRIKRREGDQAKYQYLRRLGKLIVQRECDFFIFPRQANTLKTRIPRIMHRRDTHDTLLNAIKNGQVFGFARASVSFPPHILCKPETQGFLFPPITRAVSPWRESLLSPFARQQWESRKCPPLPARAIVQTFTCQDQLLLSETLAYYANKLGAQIEITHFIQYVGERAFTPFCEKVIDLRKRSKREDNAAMGVTAKLIGNSAYGKTLGKFNIFIRIIIF